MSIITTQRVFVHDYGELYETPETKNLFDQLEAGTIKKVVKEKCPHCGNVEFDLEVTYDRSAQSAYEELERLGRVAYYNE